MRLVTLCPVCSCRCVRKGQHSTPPLTCTSPCVTPFPCSSPPLLHSPYPPLPPHRLLHPPEHLLSLLFLRPCFAAHRVPLARALPAREPASDLLLRLRDAHVALHLVRSDPDSRVREEPRTSASRFFRHSSSSSRPGGCFTFLPPRCGDLGQADVDAAANSRLCSAILSSGTTARPSLRATLASSIGRAGAQRPAQARPHRAGLSASSMSRSRSAVPSWWLMPAKWS